MRRFRGPSLLLRDLKIGEKIQLFAALSLFSFVLLTGIAVLQINAVGREVVLLGGRDIPLIKLAGRVARSHARQEVLLQHAMDAGEGMRNDPAARRSFAAARDEFLELGRLTSQELQTHTSVTLDERGASDDVLGASSSEVDYSLRGVERWYAAYSFLAERIFNLLLLGKQSEAGEVLQSPKGVADRRGLSRALHRFLAEVDQFSKSSAERAERAEGSALLGMLIVSALMVGLSVIYALFLGRSITRPIERLRNVSVELGRGNLAARMTLDSRVTSSEGDGHEPHFRDELTILAHSFNRMAEGLLKTQQELQGSQARLLQAGKLVQASKLAAVGELAGGVAHELNNPLQGVIGNARFIEQDIQKPTALPPELEQLPKYVQRVVQSAERCRDIVQGLLTFSRQSGTDKARLDLTQTVRAALDLVATKVRHQNTELRLELSPDVMCMANSTQVQQVVINLVINAAHALGKGGAITVRTESLSGHAIVRVSDTGPGIPDDVQGRIFEPFFTTKKIGEGTGLGLSVSYGIAVDHGGRLVVESAPGEGTTFVLTLPGADSDTGPGETHQLPGGQVSET